MGKSSAALDLAGTRLRLGLFWCGASETAVTRPQPFATSPSCRVISRPMPLPPPVTSATLPANMVGWKGLAGGDEAIVLALVKLQGERHCLAGHCSHQREVLTGRHRSLRCMVGWLDGHARRANPKVWWC